jgi:hypothetical protein
MSFLNPIMLAGLTAVAVPILIHLLNRRRFRKVVWAAMRFVQASVEQNRKRMRLEDLILLALRCLLLALLALALARPAVLSDAVGVLGQSRVTGVLILDNSLSMGMNDGTTTRFDNARSAAEAAVDSMPAGSAVAVLLASDVVDGAIPEPTFDLNLARKTLREAPLTDRASDLFPALQQAVTTLAGRLSLRKEIYLFTDGQALGWRQLTEIQRILENARNEIRTYIVLVNEHEVKNISVSELRMTSGLSPVKLPLRFEARVTNHGKDEARNVRVSLSVDDEPPNDEFTLDSLAAGATKSVTMFVKLRTAGIHSVTAKIPGDRLPADDQRVAVVRAVEQVNVLLVDGEPGAETRDSEVFFLKNALVPVPPRARSDYFIQTTTVLARELSQTRLDDFDAVVLANVSALTDVTLRSIESYLRRGGGLIVFPGARIDLSFYNTEMAQRLNLLPAEFGDVHGQAEEDSSFLTFQQKDYQHPIVSLWNDPAAGNLGSAKFFKYFELNMSATNDSDEVRTQGDARSSSNQSRDADPEATEPAEVNVVGLPQVILRYADGTAAVMERRWGLGRVVQFSSTADTAWNDLPVRLAWVPLMHRTLGSIVERQDEGLNIRVGERFSRRVPTEYLDKDALIQKPRRTDVVRELKRVELSQAWPTLRFGSTDVAGRYDVRLGERPLKLSFAVQPDPDESTLDELSSDQVRTLDEVATVVDWAPDLSIGGLVEKSRTGLEFWLPLVVVCLLIAGVETFLGQWFSRSK